MRNKFSPSWISCLDESMGKWISKFSYPGFCCVLHQLWPLGNEYHTIACDMSGILYYVDLTEGRNGLPQGSWLCNDIDVIIWDIRKSWWWKKSISEWRQVILLWKRLHYYFKILNKFIIIFNIVMLSMLTIQVGFSQLYLKKLGRLSNMFFFISKKLILMVLQDTVKFYQQRYYIAF